MDESEVVEDEVSTPGLQALNCEATGENKAFAGPTGKKFRVKCPKACMSKPGVV